MSYRHVIRWDCNLETWVLLSVIANDKELSVEW